MILGLLHLGGVSEENEAQYSRKVMVLEELVPQLS